MKRALVTGAGQRLGRAMAVELARRGYDVALHYATSAAGAEEAATQIRAMGRMAVTLQADLLEEDAVQSLLPRAADALGGPITCLINNASIFEYDTIKSATRQSWDRHFESNLRAPFALTQALAAQVPVGAGDLAIVLASWSIRGSCGNCLGGLDGDGVVNAGDLAAVLAAWGPCAP